MATPSYVLSDQHCACIDAVLAKIQETSQLLNDCKDCGLPVDDYMAQNAAQKQLASAIKAKFFPQMP